MEVYRSPVMSDVNVPSTTGTLSQDNDVVAEIESVFKDILYHQIYESNYDGPIDDTLNIATRISETQHPELGKLCRELRITGDEIAKTSKREYIKKKANEVNSEVNYEVFQSFLSEMITDGRPFREILMFLFLLCADVAIKELKKKAFHLCKKFIGWSIRFIRENVSRWVSDQGGWDAVISSSMSHPKKVFLSSSMSVPKKILLVSGVVVLIGIGLVQWK